MTYLHALILGLIEGFTEFLPISSTGHLILANKLLGLTETDFLKSFDIIIQLGAILAVIVLYFKSFFRWPLLKRLVVAFIPTGIIGLLLYKTVKTYLLSSIPIVLWSLLIGGAILILFEWWHGREDRGIEDMEKISYTQAVGIGLFQSIAIIPGVSRAAATIVGGMLLGLKRRTIVEFSFLLAVPTMLAATGLDLVKNAGAFSINQFWLLAVGFLSSFLVALAAIKYLLAFIKNHTFIPFGIYRLAVALIFLVVL